MASYINTETSLNCEYCGSLLVLDVDGRVVMNEDEKFSIIQDTYLCVADACPIERFQKRVQFGKPNRSERSKPWLRWIGNG